MRYARARARVCFDVTRFELAKIYANFKLSKSLKLTVFVASFEVLLI